MAKNSEITALQQYSRERDRGHISLQEIAAMKNKETTYTSSGRYYSVLAMQGVESLLRDLQGGYLSQGQDEFWLEQSA